MLPEHDRRQIAFTAAEQSGFFLALDVERFTPLVPFTEDVDYLMEQARSMRPLPGFKASALPGGFEHDREQEYGRLGIPIGVETVKALTGLARELGLRVPWSGDSPEGA
jgi:LDH2 family malate/lactate/ureidoglycolate dehydrogenase